MRSVLSTLVVLLVVGCTSAAPVEGPQGLIGTQGPQGEQGPIGLDGRDGKDGLSAVSVTSLPAGGSCAKGGAVLRDQDGGFAVLCDGVDGAQGARGETGAVGPAGAQGPQGASAHGMVVFSNDGGIVGSVIQTFAVMNVAHIEEFNCIGTIDYATQKMVAIEATIEWSQPNCLGTPHVQIQQQYMFPMGCLSVGAQTFKVRQPVQQVTLTGGSRQYVAAFQTEDGGVQITNQCTNQQSSVVASPIEEIPNFRAPVGPFTYGIR